MSNRCFPGISFGPTSFHDVATCVSFGSNVNMFADDIALYHIIKTAADYAYLQEDVDATAKCIQEKDLQFNATKRKMMLISRKRLNIVTPPQIILNGVVLNSVQNYKYLGITLTSN